jgi:hypothetical protein
VEEWRSAASAGSGTAGSNDGTAGTAGAVLMNAGKAAPYRNCHGDDDAVAGSGNGIVFTSARYKNVKTQRQLRGEHTAIGTGPTADCGSIFVEGDNRTSRAEIGLPTPSTRATSMAAGGGPPVASAAGAATTNRVVRPLAHPSNSVTSHPVLHSFYYCVL